MRSGQTCTPPKSGYGAVVPASLPGSCSPSGSSGSSLRLAPTSFVTSEVMFVVRPTRMQRSCRLGGLPNRRAQGSRRLTEVRTGTSRSNRSCFPKSNRARLHDRARSLFHPVAGFTKDATRAGSSSACRCTAAEAWSGPARHPPRRRPHAAPARCVTVRRPARVAAAARGAR